MERSEAGLHPHLLHDVFDCRRRCRLCLCPPSLGERLRVRRGTLQLNGGSVPTEIVEMIKAQANDHLTMSRDLSEKQKTLDRQKLLGDEQGFIRSGYARAMAIDALRAKSRRRED
jgi:hypothetical protein